MTSRDEVRRRGPRPLTAHAMTPSTINRKRRSPDAWNDGGRASSMAAATAGSRSARQTARCSATPYGVSAVAAAPAIAVRPRHVARVQAAGFGRVRHASQKSPAA